MRDTGSSAPGGALEVTDNGSQAATPAGEPVDPLLRGATASTTSRRALGRGLPFAIDTPDRGAGRGLAALIPDGRAVAPTPRPRPAMTPDERGAAERVEAQWLIAAGALHHAELNLVELTALALDEYLDRPVTTTCEQTLDGLALPGTTAQLLAIRCEACCLALGMPTGNGSPERDARCTPALRSRRTS